MDQPLSQKGEGSHVCRAENIHICRFIDRLLCKTYLAEASILSSLYTQQLRESKEIPDGEVPK